MNIFFVDSYVGASILLCATVIAWSLTTAHAHGHMVYPPARGGLTKRTPGSLKEIDSSAPVDNFIHFPSGDKRQTKGAGKNYQKAQYRGKKWTPFAPLGRSFVWRAGVCGDKKEKNASHDHLRGGKFYHGGKIVEEYQSGGKIDVTITFNAHHNGFMELYVCDVLNNICNGEISEKCFRSKYCRQLKRAKNPKCDSGYSKHCGPIDHNYPGRWYFPCKSGAFHKNNRKYYGFGTILYEVPDDLRCEHCVLHWFWTSANNCNPPGVKKYFTGPNAPKWGSCTGEGGAIGGYSRNEECGKQFPEEYNLCSDIKIVGGGGKNKSNKSVPTPTAKPAPASKKPSTKKSPGPTKTPAAKRPRPNKPKKEKRTGSKSPKPRETPNPKPSVDDDDVDEKDRRR